MTPQSKQYLETVLRYAQEDFLHMNKVNWSEVRAHVFDMARDAQISSDTYPALEWLADHLNSFSYMPHNYFVRPSTGPLDSVPDAVAPRGQRLEHEIGYVWLPKLSGHNVHGDRPYADVLQEVIAGIDFEPTRGWIVDLRENGGGHCWPMLAGIAPILGQGECGAFVGSTGVRFAWDVQNGSGSINGNLISSVSGTPYVLRKPNPPVAVLLGPITASSGEIVTVAFTGRLATRSFGTNTSGFSTATDAKVLEDDAWFNLTTTDIADRTGRTYGGPLEPDEIVADGWNLLEPEKDACVQRATAWLKSQTQ
jgi:carboxyl-terminal processing protease